MDTNPKEISDFREENLPNMVVKNDFNANNIYDIEDVKPELGNSEDITTRTTNLTRNRFTASNQYNGPSRLP